MPEIKARVEEKSEEINETVEVVEDYANSHAKVRRVRQMLNDTRAQGSFMKKGVDIAVGLLVVGILTAYLLPIAIDELVGVDTSSWGSAEKQLFDLLPIFFVLGVLLFVIAKSQDYI